MALATIAAAAQDNLPARVKESAMASASVKPESTVRVLARGKEDARARASA